MKMKLCLALVAGFLFTPAVMKAQAPAGSTGQCKDGTYTSAKSKRGACSGHGGVGTWTATSTTSAPVTPAPATTAVTPAPSPAPAPTPAPTPAPVSRSTPVSVPSGTGQVWVNTDSHVYHCPGTRYYGKTKAGKYVTESQASSEGDRPAYGKACSAK